MAAVLSNQKVDVSIAARQYVANGWALVPIPAGTKGPRANGWNSRANCVTTADACARIRGNVGLAHLFSRTCVLDFDDLAKSAEWLAQKGLSFDMLWNAPDAVRISSGRPNRGKLLFRLPDGIVMLRSQSIKAVGLELRCASAAGLTVQDVLPPSVHPDTGEPYRWEYAEPLMGDWRTPPVLPADVLQVWLGLIPLEQENRERGPLGLDAAAALELISAKDPDEDYLEWVRVGMALHLEFSGAWDGLQVWDEWSSTGAKYKGLEDLEKRWAGFKDEGDHLANLEAIRRELGGGPLTEDDFEDLGMPDVEQATPAAAQVPGISDDFEDLGPAEQQEEAAPAPVKKGKFEVQRPEDFAQARKANWLIKGFLPKAQLVVVYGASGSGKSFLVLDMVAAICRGLDWRGLRTARGKAVYICAEGANGFRSRMTAYARQHDIPVADMGLGVVDAAPNLTEKAEVLELIGELRKCGPLDLIVVDTFARAMAGGNENDSKDVGVVVANCDMIRRKTGAMVLLVHHSGKDATKGARGSSALRAAADAEIEVIRTREYRAATVTKMKDGEDGAEFAFNLNTVVLDFDDDGEAITSCVVEHRTMPPAHQRKSDPEGVNEKLVFQYMKALPEEDMGRIPRQELIDNLFEMLEHEGGPGKKDRRKERVAKAITSLARKNLLIDAGSVIELVE